MLAAGALLVSSCSQDDLASKDAYSRNAITLNPSMGLETRATETVVGNLGTFYISAFQDGEANYMNKVAYTSSDGGNNWSTTAGKFYWPVEGDLHFYGYAPETPGKSGEFKLDKDAQTFTGFSPEDAAADQKDFVYAKATGSNASSGSTGLNVTFNHALSEISVKAKNENTAYTVVVRGVKIGNVKTKGDFTFPAVGSTENKGSWTLSDATEDVGSYTTTLAAAETLSGTVSNLGTSNEAFMLLPQQLEKAAQASNKAYIALDVKITMQGGKVVRDGLAYVGIDTNWEMGKHYTYTLDFTAGAGQDETGKQIISGKDIKLNVDVTPWDAKAVDLPEKVITGTASAAFTYKMGGQTALVTK